ncbi:hypothetical protein LEL_06916 [Akanthomyces lecanii RCEF 1005]|uniref:Uncharacterized protein n=1 Tax=Akanthomyces lecanii RCEF 1005 TaxID=1081108 RepID=A0A162KHB1_CORDF|nr:hypothetical protein LEL_06916 [Akanthomyces lecanii RCEF 1005]
MKIVAVIAFFLAAGAIAHNEPETPGRIDLAPNALPMAIKGKGKGRASKKDSCDKCILRCNDLAAEIHKSLATDALDRCNSKVCGPFCPKKRLMTRSSCVSRFCKAITVDVDNETDKIATATVNAATPVVKNGTVNLAARKDRAWWPKCLVPLFC